MTSSGGAGAHDADPRAVPVIRALVEIGWSVAVAESLTGGAVTAALTSVPGASAVVRGGVVAYATDLKATLLDVDPVLLEAHGPVAPEVALAMAAGVAHRAGASLGLATTGVAGPDPQGGFPPGTVYVACHAPDSAAVRHLVLPGSRREVRDATVTAVLALAGEVVAAGNAVRIAAGDAAGNTAG